MITRFLIFIALLFVVLFFSIKKNKLSISAAIAAAVIGFCIFFGAGFAGISLIALFFLLGVSATSWKTKTKERLGAAEKNHGRRSAGQVLANGGVAGIAGLLCCIFKEQQEMFQLMMAASLASAAADTLSSELGTVYGKKFYNIVTLQRDRRGDNGVVSVEGTLIGLTGATLIALVYVAGFGWSRAFVWIIAAGFSGNAIDSLLGATLERNGYLKNDAVNFINTLMAALLALGWWKLF